MVALNARLWTRREAAPARATARHGRTEKLFPHLAVSTVFSFMKIQKNGEKMREKLRFPESAMLLPGKYGQKRVKNYDVRHNLKSFKKPDTRDQ
jgi:hypothetical protein